MRNEITRLNTTTLPWIESGPGVYIKVLNLAEDTGERTVLLKLVPSEGMTPPRHSHYHAYSEELLVVEGRMTFDGDTWLDRMSHCFHPAKVIHGFASSVASTTILLARSPKELDSVEIRQPKYSKPHPADTEEPEFVDCYISDVATKAWEALPGQDPGEDMEYLPLTSEANLNEDVYLARCGPGVEVKLPVGASSYQELFLLDGAIVENDQTRWDSGSYYHVRGDRLTGMKAGESGATFYVALGKQ